MYNVHLEGSQCEVLRGTVEIVVECRAVGLSTDYVKSRKATSGRVYATLHSLKLEPPCNLVTW